ncbi:MAG: type-F conjugative transfer system pilin assembly protein TrbC [Alphaproteobacteria bacterium 41-28]|nr:MAG: type-F conjugative transfer system pilin assembly protein TrbC [Alphaproteobacteria bacterium 41-28]
MLRNLALTQLIFIFFFLASGQIPVHASQNFSQNAEMQKLQEDSLKKVETLLNDKNFQTLVSELNTKASCSSENLPIGKVSKQELSCSFNEQLDNQVERFSGFDFPFSYKEENKSKGELYIFVSFSLGEKALLNLAMDAKRYGATLILRGFRERSYRKTINSLQKIIQKTGQGFIIDPELFTLFGITAVPTFILAKPFQLSASDRTQTPLHDRIQGHISAQYALETFAKGGDLKDEAKALLAESLLERGELK